MQSVFSLINFLLPFEWARYDFMKNAFVAVLLISPIFGLLSTMVVNNRMAFFSDSIGHSTLTGIGIGVLLGLKMPVGSMLITAVIFALLIVVIKHSNTVSTDTIIGVFSSTAVAIGLVILSKGGGFNKYSSYLIGDLLSISGLEIGFLAIAFVGVILFWLLFFNRLLMVSINKALSQSRGIKAFWFELAFTVAIAAIVTVSIRWIGLLIINSLLILPGAAARNIARNIRSYHVYSVAISVIAGIAGLILSYYWGTSTGATITLICAGFYFVTFVLKRRL